MKRSEALNIIYEVLLGPFPYNDDGGVQMQFMAVKVLEALEKAGLLPQNPVATNWLGAWENENE